MQNAIGLARVVLAQATLILRMDGTSARKVCGRLATQSSRPWRRTGRRERALPAVQEYLIVEGLRTSDRTRASTSSSRTRRFASWTKKRPPGPSGHSCPRRNPSDMLAGETSQRRRRRTPGELSCPCAGASGVGQGVLPGRFLPSPLEHPRGQAGRGPIQSGAPNTCLPELRDRRHHAKCCCWWQAARGPRFGSGSLDARGNDCLNKWCSPEELQHEMQHMRQAIET